MLIKLNNVLQKSRTDNLNLEYVYFCKIFAQRLCSNAK